MLAPRRYLVSILTLLVAGCSESPDEQDFAQLRPMITNVGDSAAEAFKKHLDRFRDCEHGTEAEAFFYQRCVVHSAEGCEEYLQYFPSGKKKENIEEIVWKYCEADGRDFACETYASNYRYGEHYNAAYQKSESRRRVGSAVEDSLLKGAQQDAQVARRLEEAVSKGSAIQGAASGARQQMDLDLCEFRLGPGELGVSDSVWGDYRKLEGQADGSSEALSKLLSRADTSPEVRDVRRRILERCTQVGAGR